MRTEAKEKYKIIRAMIEARKSHYQEEGKTEAADACETILHDLTVWYEAEQALSGENA